MKQAETPTFKMRDKVEYLGQPWRIVAFGKEKITLQLVGGNRQTKIDTKIFERVINQDKRAAGLAEHQAA